MAATYSQGPTRPTMISSSVSNDQEQEYKWEKKYIIDNLPPWIYTNYEQPKNMVECEAMLLTCKYTIEDIDLQITIRELGEDTSDKNLIHWKRQALKAKQTHANLLHAYSYWKIFNETDQKKAKEDKQESYSEKLEELEMTILSFGSSLQSTLEFLQDSDIGADPALEEIMEGMPTVFVDGVTLEEAGKKAPADKRGEW